jgi:argininosuccinate synthase
LEIEFEQGIPVALDGERMDGVPLVERLTVLAGGHGIGRIDHIENRLVGIKSREIYEAPAAVVLHAAHAALEQMTLTKTQVDFKVKVGAELANLIYNGLWFSAHTFDLMTYVTSTQRFVTGAVRVKMFKGSFAVTGRKSPHSLYSPELATYGQGDLFQHDASVGFIQLYGLPLRTQAQLQFAGRTPEQMMRAVAQPELEPPAGGS